MKLNKYFDHTLLKPDATDQQIAQLCREAKEMDFCAVCVNSSFVSAAAEELAGTDIKIASVVGFPLGACTTNAKRAETEEACLCGASEIDMVLHIGKLRCREYDYVKNDIREVVLAAAKYGACVKVILETGLLTDEEIVEGCKAAESAGARFVKTSTGFLAPGANAHAVRLMKQTVGSRLLIKASGGIRSYAAAMEMIEAGADRIGASACVSIVREAAEREETSAI